MKYILTLMVFFAHGAFGMRWDDLRELEFLDFCHEMYPGAVPYNFCRNCWLDSMCVRDFYDQYWVDYGDNRGDYTHEYRQEYIPEYEYSYDRQLRHEHEHRGHEGERHHRHARNDGRH